MRVVSNSGRGGFVPDKPYELLADDIEIDLKGKWRYRLGAEMNPAPGQTFVRWKPTGLFNGMIAPLTNFSINRKTETGKADLTGKFMPVIFQAIFMPADNGSNFHRTHFPCLFNQFRK